MLVEKRIAGIIRWLERLKQSYSSGLIESALMDAECARADLENLRQDVWAQVRPRESSVNALSRMGLYVLRVLSLSVLIVMVHVVPLSREMPVPAAERAPVAKVSSAPIIIIREYEAPKPEAPAVPTPSPAPRKQPAARRTAQKRTQAQANTAPAVKTQASAGTVPYDKVYSLIQTGQRALKNNSSVIKIQ